MNYQPETRKETLENSIQIHKKKEENTIEKTKNEIFKMFGPFSQERNTQIQKVELLSCLKNSANVLKEYKNKETNEYIDEIIKYLLKYIQPMNIKELWLYTRIKKELLHEKLEEIEDATKRILQQNNIENSNIENIEKDSNTTAFLYMIQYAHKTGKITEDQAKKIKLTLKLYGEKQAYKEFRSNFIEKNKN